MKKVIVYLLLIPALLVRCNPENEETPEALTQSRPGVGGVLLAEVKPAEDYVVQFLEIEPGMIAMHASYSGDLKDLANVNMAGMNAKGKSVLEIYKTLAKNQINKNQLKALEAASERLKQSAPSSSEFDNLALNSLKSGNTEARVDRSLQSACPSLAGNAEDALWWRETYGPFSGSSANQTDQSFEVTAYEVNFCAMAAANDFGGYFLTYHKNSNGSWRNWLDFYMPPRTVHFYGFWSNKRHVFRGDVIGIAPCAKVSLGYRDVRR